MSAQINNKVSGLLHKFRSGDITPAEFQDLRTHMDTISDVELKHLLEAEWEEFEDHSPLSEEKMKTLYEGLHIRSEEGKPRFTLKRYWMQIAASLLLLIAGSLTVLTFMQQNEINALAEQNVVIRSGDYGKSLVTLPDGTIVHLNAKSSLTYSQDFGRNDRKVALSGEGFFEVKKDTEKKFTVGTGYLDIIVLGTKFNVYAYETKDIVEMSLVEGSVDVTTSRPPYQSIRVKPNEKVVYNKHTGNLLHERTSNKMETAWMNKELVFRSERLENVFRCLSRKFAVTFSVDDETLLNDVYTGTFDDENVESIMRVLKYHYKFKYTNEDGVISIQTRK
ncbi:FecR family protein [Phocaeicola plebeius]|uniref:FecR family protein n=1 Tax=Phocaeicola plebeius TaxID=310297 RepID=UPI001958BABC|nr:FecR family protein [Phocaeicola plebeius]MBM6963977.1 FecR family protein [Phocaeicola plebeius]